MRRASPLGFGGRSRIAAPAFGLVLKLFDGRPETIDFVFLQAELPFQDRDGRIGPAAGQRRQNYASRAKCHVFTASFLASEGPKSRVSARNPPLESLFQSTAGRSNHFYALHRHW